MEAQVEAIAKSRVGMVERYRMLTTLPRELDPNDFAWLLASFEVSKSWIRQAKFMCRFATKLDQLQLTYLFDAMDVAQFTACLKEFLTHDLVAHTPEAFAYVLMFVPFEALPPAYPSSLACLSVCPHEHKLDTLRRGMHEYAHARLPEVLAACPTLERQVIAEVLKMGHRKIDASTMETMRAHLPVSGIFNAFEVDSAPPDLEVQHRVRKKRKQLAEEAKVNIHQICVAPTVDKPPQTKELVCAVCMERGVTTVLHPCGHACLCGGCASTIADKDGVCPLCQALFIEVRPVFFA
jgi:hypothetical protein